MIGMGENQIFSSALRGINWAVKYSNSLAEAAKLRYLVRGL